MTKSYYPAALTVKNRSCLIIGNNSEASDKGIRLLDSGAKVTLITNKKTGDAAQNLKENGATVLDRKFEENDIKNQFFVILCIRTDSPLSNTVARLCRENKVLLCAIDQPSLCDVVNVSVVDKGPLRFTISTQGAAPSVAKKIRLGLESSLAASPVDHYLDYLGKMRETLEKEIQDPDKRREKLMELTKDFTFQAKIHFPDWWIAKSKSIKS